jgi:hypothetical protein
MFLESVIVLDAAMTQVAVQRLKGQQILFRDASRKLQEQIQMAETLSEHFNVLARAVGVVEINPEELRNNLEPEKARHISGWVNLARAEMLSVFGQDGELHAAMEEFSLL